MRQIEEHKNLWADHNIKTLHPEEDAYPDLLKNIAQPPRMLYYRGDISLLDKPAVAIVGARKATPYGRWVAYEMAKKLADYDIVVVSGMALGIDTYAHKGALDNKGKTIAVLGCGPDICYPTSNKGLMDEIINHGLILSEYEPGMSPLPHQFPMRNRIISGLSLGTVIVEAGLKSGSLITATCAADQGRTIYAVPGNINSLHSIGTNRLIQDGATPIVVFDDIIDDLGISRKVFSVEDDLRLGRDEQMIYQAIGNGGEVSYDYLYLKTGKPSAEVNAIVTILEMKGLVRTGLGKVFIAK